MDKNSVRRELIWLELIEKYLEAGSLPVCLLYKKVKGDEDADGTG